MEVFNSTVGEAEKQISELKDKATKHTQSEVQLENKIKRQEESSRELWLQNNKKRSKV